MSDLKNIKNLISSDNLNIPNLDNDDVKKYIEHPLIAPLHLTQPEFRKNAAIIKKMVDEEIQNEKTFGSVTSLSRIRLIRDDKGNLKLKAIPIEQTIRIDNIRRNYLIRNFPDEDLCIMLNNHFFSKVDPSKAKLLNKYKEFLTSYPTNGLYVYGKVGIGKTYTSIALANEFANQGKKVAFVFVPEAIHDVKLSFNDKDSKQQFELENKMKSADVLFLDDIGIEDVPWFYNENLLVVLNYRMQHHKLTFFTSNLSLELLEKKFMTSLKKGVNVERLLERIKGLTKNSQFELQGINKRY